MIAMLVPSKASSLACVLMWAPRHPVWRNHGVVMDTVTQVRMQSIGQQIWFQN